MIHFTDTNLQSKIAQGSESAAPQSCLLYVEDDADEAPRGVVFQPNFVFASVVSNRRGAG